VAGHKINLGKRQRSYVKLLYAEIRQNSLFTNNAAFPVGQARFVIWWLSTFPGTTFPTQDAIEAAIHRQHPDEFDFQNWDSMILDNAAERHQSTDPPTRQPEGPPRSLAERISVPA
jgi:hypothetical protein